MFPHVIFARECLCVCYVVRVIAVVSVIWRCVYACRWPLAPLFLEYRQRRLQWSKAMGEHVLFSWFMCTSLSTALSRFNGMLLCFVCVRRTLINTSFGSIVYTHFDSMQFSRQIVCLCVKMWNSLRYVQIGNVLGNIASNRVALYYPRTHSWNIVCI